MKRVYNERVKSARLMSGFTLDDLARELEAINKKISRQALHTYETGEICPDDDKLIALSMVLKVPVDYFYREVKFVIEEPRFRKLNKMPAREVTKIIEYTKDQVERFLELEDAMGLSCEFKDPLTSSELDKVETFDHIEYAANEVRKYWDLGAAPIHNIVELMEDYNIKIIGLNVDEDFDGMQTKVNKTIPVIVYNKNKEHKKDRLRLTLLHELGHLLLDIGHLPHARQEQICYQFAAALLLPQGAINIEVGTKRKKLLIQELGHLKQHYGISIQAILFRLRDLKVISNTYFNQFYSYLRQMDWIIDEPFNYDGVEKSNRFDQLIYRALAEGNITMEKAASLRNQDIDTFKSDSQAFA